MLTEIYIYFAKKITPSRAKHILNVKKLRKNAAHSLLRKSGVIIPPSSCIVAPFHFGSGNIAIGENTYINYDCICIDYSAIKIGSNVLIGPRVTLSTVTHPTEPTARLSNQRNIYSPITIEDNVFIGTNVTILPGVTIGANSVIAANSVVTSSVPADCLYAGTPARFKKSL
ncbi:DapH/DapD/GlmU-related protein [Serratia symbiotica]|uniref:DapH/DapD/GlmU-related protein n=1 Tax=Serratia symbiotica TaxID=138074 RepID=UPI00136F8353|nr:DapH/DapD/GlmU-related protein [Serratia symbiotica]MBQ0956494.1 acetyltransferase [Serratia symbiotica]